MPEERRESIAAAIGCDVTDIKTVKEIPVAKPPIGMRDISTTYQIAYETYDGNAQVRKIGDRLWEILRRGGASFYEKSKAAALERAFQIAGSASVRGRSSHATKKMKGSSPADPDRRFADLQLQGFMKRSPVRTWVVAVEDPSGDPSAATYIEVQGKTEAAALRAAQTRKPGRKLTVRYAR